MTEPNIYPPELIDALGAVLAEHVTEKGVPSTGTLYDALDALRAEGWIVQPAPVPGVPVNALPDGPPAPGAPADPGTPIDGPNW